MNFNIYKNIKKQGDLVFLCLILFFGLALNKIPIIEGWGATCTNRKKRRYNNKINSMRLKARLNSNIHGWQYDKISGSNISCNREYLKFRYKKGDEFIEERKFDDIVTTIKIKENIKIGIIIFFKKDVFTMEILIIIIKAKKVKIRCFVKKK